MKKFKKILFVILLIPSIFLFSACSTPTLTAKSIASIEKYSTTGLVDTYQITYTDDSVSYFTVTNGQDGTNGDSATNVSIEDIYTAALESGYTGSFLDFLQEYLSFDNVDTARTIAVNQALLSSVSIYSNYTTTRTAYQLTPSGYQPYTYDYDYTSAGSGIIYSLDKENGDAYIITNYHVVYDSESNTENNISDEIYVYFYGLESTDYSVQATYVGGSMNYDIAVLQITSADILKTSDYQAVNIENSDDIVVGSTAIAIGNPEAEGISATEGIVSVDSEYITMTAVDDVTQVTFRVMRIDTAVNSGNSGGGLFNESGDLIGIVNAKIIDSSIENIAYAIPSNIATRVAQNIIDNAVANSTDKVQKVIFGITINPASVKAVYNETTLATDIVEVVAVSNVAESSLAESLGFQLDDVIISIEVNDIPLAIDRTFTLVDSTLSMRVGDTVTFNIERDSVPMQITHTITANDMVEIN